MKQALFIGQAPAFFGQATPLVGKAAKRLESLSGLTAAQLDRNLDKIKKLDKLGLKICPGSNNYFQL